MHHPTLSPPVDAGKIIAKQNEADQAYRLAIALVKKYIPTFADPHPGPTNDVFEFFEKEAWAEWYKKNHFAGSQTNNTEALTVYNPPKIGVNLAYHTIGTLVHESFHYLSHPNFRNAVNSLQLEGFIELLARLALNLNGPRQDVNNQGDFYGQDYAKAKKYIDVAMPKDVETLLKALVQGDPLSIKHIQLLIKMM